MNKVKLFENFIDPLDCEYAVNLYNKYRDNNVFKLASDDRLLIHNPRQEEAVYLVNKYLKKISAVYNTTFYARDVLLSIYDLFSGVEPHIDFTSPKLKNSLGFLLYFNDEFEGGELYFPNFNLEYKPIKGSAAVFPCNDKEYIHGVKPITKGIRYAMPIELTEDKSLNLYN
jgi:predicted 2-oxoglutarate/Fe(II)-dependent dioxygenase YbiX